MFRTNYVRVSKTISNSSKGFCSCFRRVCVVIVVKVLVAVFTPSLLDQQMLTRGDYDGGDDDDMWPDEGDNEKKKKRSRVAGRADTTTVVLCFRCR